MKNILDILRMLFENSGFFFVPILSTIALINLSALSADRKRTAFLLISGITLVGYLAVGIDSSRYLLIPLLLVGLLAGAGATAPLKYLHKIKFLKWLQARHLLIFFTALTLICGLLKLTFREPSAALDEFAEKLNSPQHELILYSVESSRGARLGVALRNHPDKKFYSFVNWQQCIKQLSVDQTSDVDKYFFTDIPTDYTAEDFLLWFRGKYCLAPFEIIHSQRQGSHNYILLKFNGKILDGSQNSLRFNALNAMPETLQIIDYRNWAVSNIAGYLPQIKSALYIPNNGTAFHNQVFFRKSNQMLPADGTLQLRNALTWLEAERSFKLSTTTPDPQAVSFTPVQAQVSNADAPPLITPAEKIYLSSNQEFIHLSGASALWSQNDQRFEFSGGEKHPAIPGRLDFTLRDTVLNTSANSSLTLIKEDLRDLTGLRGKILLLQDEYGKRLNLQENLLQLLPPQLKITGVNIPSGGESSIQTALNTVLPEENFQLILLNIFQDTFTRDWTIPLQVDPFMDKHLTALAKKLRSRYPKAFIALLVPPPPAPGASFYALLNSVQLSRLAHYHSASALQRWQQRKKFPQTEILPLYYSIDPSKGYTTDGVCKNVYSGFHFTAHAQKVMAENSAAFFIYLYKNKGLFQ